MIFQITDNIYIKAENYQTRYSWGHKAWLHLDNRIVAYRTITYSNRTWERFEYEDVICSVVEKAQKSHAISKEQADKCREYIKNYKTDNRDLKTVAMIALMGEVFTDNKKDKNDWKARMLRAGLPGLDIPEDWNTLTEDEKEKRLDAVIAECRK